MDFGPEPYNYKTSLAIPSACQRLRDISDTEIYVPALPLNEGVHAMRNFDASEWDLLTSAEKIALCHRNAIQVRNEAEGCRGLNKEAYLRLAQAWLDLANSITERKPAPLRDLGMGADP